MSPISDRNHPGMVIGIIPEWRSPSPEYAPTWAKPANGMLERLARTGSHGLVPTAAARDLKASPTPRRLAEPAPEGKSVAGGSRQGKRIGVDPGEAARAESNQERTDEPGHSAGSRTVSRAADLLLGPFRAWLAGGVRFCGAGAAIKLGAQDCWIGWNWSLRLATKKRRIA